MNSHDLSPSGMSVEEFKEQAVQVNGLFVIAEATVDDNGVECEEARYFQKPDGRLPLSPVDTDARWRTSRPGKPSGLHYQENVIVDLGGFIVSRGVTHASEGEWKAVPDLLERLPLPPISLAGGHWLQRRPAAVNCWKNRTSRRTSPFIPGRKPAWCPVATLSIMATT